MKKLTAGIFTVMLGLVAVNAANAAIPSTNYVDTKIGDVETAYKAADAQIRTDFAAADTALGTRIDGVVTAYQAADTALDGRVDELETTVGEGTMSVNGNTQNDVIAAINALDAKTNGIATNENLDKLQQTVTTHTNSLNVLNGTGEGSVAKAEADAIAYTDQLANGQVKTNKEAIATNAAAIEANETAIAGKASQSDLNTLSGRVGTAEGDIDALEGLVGSTSVATQIENANNAQTASLQQYADQAETDAIASAKSYADGELAKKVDIAQGTDAVNHVVITDASGNVTTSATIQQAQVDGLTTTLAAKMADVTAISAVGSEDGTYVLTAKVAGDETTYKWEQIERNVATPTSNEE